MTRPTDGPPMKTIDLKVSIWDLESMTTLNEVIAWAEDLRNEIPEQYRATAGFSFDGNSEYPQIDVWYERPETEEDRHLVRKQAEEAAALRHAAEYQTYQRLRAKYEGTGNIDLTKPSQSKFPPFEDGKTYDTSMGEMTYHKPKPKE